MTKNDLYSLIEIIDNEVEKEKKLAEDFIKLNPTHATERNRDRDMIIHGLRGAWLAIREQYKNVAEEK